MRLTKDFLSGILFAVIGFVGLLIGMTYTLGTPARMGPGFFPVVVSGLVLLFGLAVAGWAAARPREGEEDEVAITVSPRPIVFLCLAVIAFGISVQHLGLVAALTLLIVIGRFAGDEGSVGEVAAMVVLVNLLIYLVFILGLGLHLPLGPR